MPPFSLLYVCGDDVNRDLVRRRLDRRGLTLADERPVDACLIDHNHLPFGMSPEEVVPLLMTFTGRPRCLPSQKAPLDDF